MEDSILIVGAGQAGLEIAVTLRTEGFAGGITLVGEEDWAPYQRPPLSKGYLGGTEDEESLLFRDPTYYADNKIEVVTGQRVVDVQMRDDLCLATTESGRSFEFTKLALAPGSRPRVLRIDGDDLEGVLYLRDLRDARALRSRWRDANDVVIVGGGFIGLEVAATARKAGKTVTVLEANERLIRRAVAPSVSEFYLTAHERRGTKIVVGARLSRFVGVESTVSGIELDSGQVIPADLILVGIGAIPRAELAEKMGLDTVNGAITVDEYARTSDPRVVAAGDAVVLPHPLGNDMRVRLECVQNAVEQARVAARTLMGDLRPYHVVPWFWSDQDDLKLQMAGLPTDFDEVVERGNRDDEKFSMLYYRDGQLIAVHSVNDPIDYVAARRALSMGANIPAHLAADSSVRLKTLITDGSDTPESTEEQR